MSAEADALLIVISVLVGAALGTVLHLYIADKERKIRQLMNKLDDALDRRRKE